MGDFEALIGALWADLGLEAPGASRGSARLTVDGQAIALTLSPDEGQVVVSTVLGPLARDPPREADQLRQLLRDGAGMVLGCRAGLCLRSGRDAGDPPVASVEAVSPCRGGAVPALRRAVEDVLLLADVHRPTLAVGGPLPGGPPTLPADDHLIFRL